MKQARVYIKGDVTGVGFRAWTKIQAKALGVKGWVRNVYEKPEAFGASGGVEALIQGEEEKVHSMLERLKQGPPVSTVSDITVNWEEVDEKFDQFEIKR